MLGIIGGMGPQAGISLYQQVLAHTTAQKDQDHVPTILWSTPGRIPDRTAYLLGRERINPAYPVAEIVGQLGRLGVTVAAIPCNTFHAPAIWDEFIYTLMAQRSDVQVVHLVEETVRAIKAKPRLTKLGLLSTLGTYKSRLYTDLLEAVGVEVVEPCNHDQVRLHDAIYHPKYGVKSLDIIGQQAGDIILEVAERLQTENFLLGCTELCLEWQDTSNLLEHKFELVNPLAIVAKVMVQTFQAEAVKI